MKLLTQKEHKQISGGGCTAYKAVRYSDGRPVMNTETNEPFMDSRGFSDDNISYCIFMGCDKYSDQGWEYIVFNKEKHVCTSDDRTNSFKQTIKEGLNKLGL